MSSCACRAFICKHVIKYIYLYDYMHKRKIYVNFYKDFP